MAVTERQRHELLARAQDVLGPDPGATLMELLPPAGWGDVVTREVLDHRLEVLEARMDARFAQVDARFAQVDARFAEVAGDMDARFAEVRADLHEELRKLQFNLLAGAGVLVGIVGALVGFLG